ncbi:MAG: chemotaxis protein [Helicobacteraceae bacterium]|nr:chemotaxis protein [Helicobacteraceae bacterium]
MTQEELDSLMSEDLNDAIKTDEAEIASDTTYDQASYRAKADVEWPPPPPSAEHRVVHQLDDVAREGEEKSSQIFDILEAIGSDATETENLSKGGGGALNEIASVFERLHSRFPHIQTFAAQLELCADLKKRIDQIERIAQKTNDQVMVAMDVMQFQDIHRQKIERVINVMRALSRYMNSLFDTKVADEKRVGSAVHIAGDSTEDVVNEDDIEALIAAFGGKK